MQAKKGGMVMEVCKVENRYIFSEQGAEIGWLLDTTEPIAALVEVEVLGYDAVRTTKDKLCSFITTCSGINPTARQLVNHLEHSPRFDEDMRIYRAIVPVRIITADDVRAVKQASVKQ